MLNILFHLLSVVFEKKISSLIQSPSHEGAPHLQTDQGASQMLEKIKLESKSAVIYLLLAILGVTLTIFVLIRFLFLLEDVSGVSKLTLMTSYGLLLLVSLVAALRLVRSFSKKKETDQVQVLQSQRKDQLHFENLSSNSIESIRAMGIQALARSIEGFKSGFFESYDKSNIHSCSNESNIKTSDNQGVLSY